MRYKLKEYKSKGLHFAAFFIEKKTKTTQIRNFENRKGINKISKK